MWKNKHTQDVLLTPDLVWMSRLIYVPRRCIYERKEKKQIVKVYIVMGKDRDRG